MSVLLVVGAGAVGAVLRVLVGLAMPGGAFPASTLVVNVLGSFALGLVAGGLEGEVARVAGAGLLGGFTTFSTFTLQTVRLPGRLAALNVAVNVAGCTLAAALGLALTA